MADLHNAQGAAANVKDAPNADVHNMFLRAAPPDRPAPSFSEHPDSFFVYNAVGQALALALAEVATKRPLDPIEYIAERLKNYKATKLYCAQRDADFSAQKLAKVKRLEEEARQQAIEEEIRHQKELEEQNRREELERKRNTVPLQAVALPRSEQRDKSGSTPLHLAARNCDAEELLDRLHEGHSFCSRDAQGQNVRDIAAASKNEAVVKEIDSLVISWIKESKVDYLRWLLASGYASSFPNLKKAFGAKLKGIPEQSRKFVESIQLIEARQRELWKLSAKGTKEHLEAHFKQVPENEMQEVFASNQQNLSAIHLALLCKNQDTASYLLSLNPKLLEMQDGFGRTPLHYAHGAGQNFVEMIHEAGGASGEDKKDAFGFVPSVYARRFELLPEAPSFESPELIVTEDADDSETPAAQEESAALDEQDVNKLTPINEEEADEN